MANDFLYEHSDIPAGMTIAGYRRERRKRLGKHPLRRRHRRSVRRVAK